MDRAVSPPPPAEDARLAALPYVREIAAYAPGKPIEELAREMGLEAHSIIKLASNENPLGAPESARRAMQAAIDEIGRYPDGNAFALRSALASRLKVPLEWVTVGSGSNDILEMAASAMLAPGRSCIFSQHAFAVYALATQARGAHGIV
ncbi:MAG TPA: aminotransferase class I/II-fold pyridoxal phosphate-dependent enzyme, partial [Burkholderiaceae bacterium]|nr:aminotransferase class I/II-fold pyridoxal phosphate-dependent enzyme [Burkholderiaceae bacterium]